VVLIPIPDGFLLGRGEEAVRSIPGDTYLGRGEPMPSRRTQVRESWTAFSYFLGQIIVKVSAQRIFGPSACGYPERRDSPALHHPRGCLGPRTPACCSIPFQGITYSGTSPRRVAWSCVSPGTVWAYTSDHLGRLSDHVLGNSGLVQAILQVGANQEASSWSRGLRQPRDCLGLQPGVTFAWSCSLDLTVC
jgi:hypothetical protein